MSEEKKLTGYPSIDKPWLKYYSDNSIMSSQPQMSVYDYVKFCNKDRLDCVALNYYGVKITFREFFANVDKVVATLCENGIRKGDVVSLGLPSVPETFYSFFAINAIGAVANFIDPRINEERILIAQLIKNPPAVWETPVQFLGWEDLLEKG